MGKQSHLLDSNVVIYNEKGISDPAALDFLTIATVDGSLISVAIEIEVLGFSFASPAALRRMEELGDAIIAATALVYDLILVTNNTDDFKGISGLALVNPFAVP